MVLAFGTTSGHRGDHVGPGRNRNAEEKEAARVKRDEWREFRRSRGCPPIYSKKQFTERMISARSWLIREEECQIAMNEERIEEVDASKIAIARNSIDRWNAGNIFRNGLGNCEECLSIGGIIDILHCIRSKRTRREGRPRDQRGTAKEKVPTIEIEIGSEDSFEKSFSERTISARSSEVRRNGVRLGGTRSRSRCHRSSSELGVAVHLVVIY
ncbi:hypothetical protein SISNIDRAFT_471486 [Sistotremastrum niveocremeum HHB9708]|uniref:Uncharacterized protein n=1 Tax=Sistotremastrum niveocremeum HHB9708 TaxID=1314777 RepID=A0A164ML64_9AGAM|nr:hypothetical protein SISNIDRAFT_471486 [Sistotremastrum niveocremeum HHB9708]